MKMSHIPVLMKEVLDYLHPQSGKNFIDCTFGGGGHTRELLKRTAPDGFVLAVDRDPAAVLRAKAVEGEFPGRFAILNKNFSLLTPHDYVDRHITIDGILLDLGVSSYQLDDPERGFSFRSTATLDMRMGDGEVSAADVINSYSQDELARIFKEYGDERYARGIARAIVEHRTHNAITMTDQLAEIIEQFYKTRPKPKGIHPATKVFQAVRMEVNHELEDIKTFLPKAIDMLAAGGRIAVISFHSGEDRIVKNIFREYAKDIVDEKSLTGSDVIRKKVLKIITKKPVEPGTDEIAVNPRSRSAKLRVAEKL